MSENIVETEYVVETENLSKHFGSQIGVNKVYMHIEKGKIYGMLGRNGAGKTTIMKMIMNLIKPTEGEIKIFGQHCQVNSKQLYSRIGCIIEYPGFYENLTGSENLQIFSRLRGVHKRESIESALKKVGLEEEKRKIFGKYSMGMKQRLGIAAAIMHEPELLILDEPINGLDPIGIHVIRQYLEELCKEKGVTILISSHILSEIEQIADTIGFIEEGKLIEEVDMEELRLRNRQYIELKVDDANNAVLILEEKLKINHYDVHENGIIRVYSHFEEQSNINKAFVENSIAVSKIMMSEEKLEDYFSKLIGGGKIG